MKAKTSSVAFDMAGEKGFNHISFRLPVVPTQTQLVDMIVALTHKGYEALWWGTAEESGITSAAYVIRARFPVMDHFANVSEVSEATGMKISYA